VLSNVQLALGKTFSTRRDTGLCSQQVSSWQLVCFSSHGLGQDEVTSGHGVCATASSYRRDTENTENENVCVVLYGCFLSPFLYSTLFNSQLCKSA